jgi:hypothetical protein
MRFSSAVSDITCVLTGTLLLISYPFKIFQYFLSYSDYLKAASLFEITVDSFR